MSREGVGLEFGLEFGLPGGVEMEDLFPLLPGP